MFNPLGKLMNLDADSALEMVRGMGVDLEMHPVTGREQIIAAVESLAQAALGSADVQIKRLVVKGDKPMQALIVMGGAVPKTGIQG
jgi:hypothetical protein